MSPKGKEERLGEGSRRKQRASRERVSSTAIETEREDNDRDRDRDQDQDCDRERLPLFAKSMRRHVLARIDATRIEERGGAKERNSREGFSGTRREVQ